GSTVTYTEVSSPFANLSNIGSPGVDGPPVMLEDPSAYVVAVFQAPPSLDYVDCPEERGDDGDDEDESSDDDEDDDDVDI
ncbi:hypothetical protein Tco_0560101, partial [Tanacetum coccineum]